ncbi:MAG: cytochrome c3 family protein [Proteobacteria bacterium]|nr:cytochrome c3 family protein [Pseudomonadota bacterium]
MIAILILVLLFPLTLHGTITSDECLGCHDKYKEYKHGKAACVDCHSNISTIPHEEKLEKPSCNRCHSKTAGRYSKSVHSKKNVACKDCHNTHFITAGRGTCVSCHEDLYRVYKETSHAKKGAAKCADCHNPHSLTPYKELSSQERMAVCSRCHKDYLAKHSWLPNTLLHFNHLECSTCHSPDSTKSMVFYFKTKGGNKNPELTYGDIEKALGSKKEIVSIIDRDGDGIVSCKELTGFFTGLSKRIQKDIFLDSSIVVTKVHHVYSEKSRKQRVCASCHSENAPFYESMYLAIPGKDSHTYIPVKGTVLSALPTSLFIDMCLLGEKKIKVKDIKEFFKTTQGKRGDIINELGFKLLDLIGLLVSAAILAGIVIHGILRIMVRK